MGRFFDPFQPAEANPDVDAQALLEALKGQVQGQFSGYNFIGASRAASQFDSLDLGHGLAMNQPGIHLSTGYAGYATENTNLSFYMPHFLEGDERFSQHAYQSFGDVGWIGPRGLVDLDGPESIHAVPTFDPSIVQFQFIPDAGVQSLNFDLILGSENFPLSQLFAQEMARYGETFPYDFAVVEVNGQNIAHFNQDPQQPLAMMDSLRQEGLVLGNQLPESIFQLYRQLLLLEDLDWFDTPDADPERAFRERLELTQSLITGESQNYDALVSAEQLEDIRDTYLPNLLAEFTAGFGYTPDLSGMGTLEAFLHLNALEYSEEFSENYQQLLADSHALLSSWKAYATEYNGLTPKLTFNIDLTQFEPNEAGAYDIRIGVTELLGFSELSGDTGLYLSNLSTSHHALSGFYLSGSALEQGSIVRVEEGSLGYYLRAQDSSILQGTTQADVYDFSQGSGLVSGTPTALHGDTLVGFNAHSAVLLTEAQVADWHLSQEAGVTTLTLNTDQGPVELTLSYQGDPDFALTSTPAGTLIHWQGAALQPLKQLSSIAMLAEQDPYSPAMTVDEVTSQALKNQLGLNAPDAPTGPQRQQLDKIVEIGSNPATLNDQHPLVQAQVTGLIDYLLNLEAQG